MCSLGADARLYRKAETLLLAYYYEKGALFHTNVYKCVNVQWTPFRRVLIHTQNPKSFSSTSVRNPSLSLGLQMAT